MKSISTIALIFLLPVSVFAQIELHFIQKDAIEFPGNAIFDLTITEINNDSFPDYAYRDSNSVYLLDGLSQSPIAIIPLEPGSELIRIGDLNGDNLKDIAMCGSNPVQPDSNFLQFYLAPDYLPEYRFQFPNSYGDWIETVSELYFSPYYGSNIVFVGTRLYQHVDNYPIHSHDIEGRILVYEFNNGIFTQQRVVELGGQLKEIQTLSYNDSSFLVLKTSGESKYGNPSIWYDYSWADLFILGSSFDTLRIWHTGLMGGITEGEIHNLLVDKPFQFDNDYIYFYSYSSSPFSESIICMDDPTGNIAWERSGDYLNYNITFSGIQDYEFREIFIFRHYFQIRNPYDGYLYEIGEIFGYIGDYLCVLDQENDHVDEYFFMGTDSLYIYNLEFQTGTLSNNISISEYFNLLNNYPNPFNSRTAIKFELSQDSNISLAIYDILGRRIAVLLNGHYSYGKYSIDWNADNLKSGIYFAVLSMDSYSKSKKMLLVK